MQTLFRPTSKWQIPQAPDGASAFVTPGAPDLSALLVRMRSRRPSTQMPPLGTVLHDREAIDLVTGWIQDLRFATLHLNPFQPGSITAVRVQRGVGSAPAGFSAAVPPPPVSGGGGNRLL